jgi:hypothetical protein
MPLLTKICFALDALPGMTDHTVDRRVLLERFVAQGLCAVQASHVGVTFYEDQPLGGVVRVVKRESQIAKVRHRLPVAELPRQVSLLVVIALVALGLVRVQRWDWAPLGFGPDEIESRQRHPRRKARRQIGQRVVAVVAQRDVIRQ